MMSDKKTIRQKLPSGVKGFALSEFLDKNGQPVKITVCNARIGQGSRVKQLRKATLRAEQRIG
jgi:hypothetical protein